MKLPLHIAKKIQQLLVPGQSIASSSMQHSSVTKMLEDGLLQKQQLSNTRSLLFISQKENVASYLKNHFSINNLDEYIQFLEGEERNRAGNVIVSGNSKLLSVRTFKGFLVNCYEDIPAIISGKQIIVRPAIGTSMFVHSYENFIPDAGVTIVGIENPENFTSIQAQQYLFQNIKPLFVSRYPQSNDLVKWLAGISNHYVHFGDIDFAGINIYMSEFKKHLGKRASWFVPPNTEILLQKFGNRNLFNRQYNPSGDYSFIEELSIQQLIDLMLKYKKVLEQEVFINAQDSIG